MTLYFASRNFRVDRVLQACARDTKWSMTFWQSRVTACSHLLCVRDVKVNYVYNGWHRSAGIFPIFASFARQKLSVYDPIFSALFGVILERNLFRIVSFWGSLFNSCYSIPWQYYCLTDFNYWFLFAVDRAKLWPPRLVHLLQRIQIVCRW